MKVTIIVKKIQISTNALLDMHQLWQRWQCGYHRCGCRLGYRRFNHTSTRPAFGNLDRWSWREDHFQASQVNGHFGTLTILRMEPESRFQITITPYVQRRPSSTATRWWSFRRWFIPLTELHIKSLLRINGTNDCARSTTKQWCSPNSFFVVGKSPT